jgi:hypothetical protein
MKKGTTEARTHKEDIMASAIATSIENVHSEELVSTNPLANLWLGLMAVCLGGTLLCTVVLVAWPILANLFAG